MNKIVKENSFEGGGGGASGTLNYGTGYGTFASPDVSQNSDNFATDNSNKALNNTSNTALGKVSPTDLKKDIDTLFTKKDTPTIDDVYCGLEFELGKMSQKDKAKAKQIVLSNLKKDPHYYAHLNQYNSTEDALTQNMTEDVENTRNNVNIDETKKIFQEMVKAKDNKYYIDPKISEVMNEVLAAKNRRNNWKNK